jgi:hypothetical protein
MSRQEAKYQLVLTHEPPDPYCEHHEVLTPPTKGVTTIGTCQKCGRKKEYTDAPREYLRNGKNQTNKISRVVRDVLDRETL